MSWSDNKGTFVESQFRLIRLRLPELSVVEAAGYADSCARAVGEPTWNELAFTDEFWVEQHAELFALPTCKEAA